MGQTRWRDRLGPPSFVLSTGLMLAVIVPTAIAAGPPLPSPGAPAACPSFEPAAVARAATGGAVAPRVKSETVLDAVGEMTGRQLSVQGARGRGPALTVSLPAESFAAPARGTVVVYGWHRPESGSEIHALDADSGCGALLARPPDVVRSAVLDPSGTSLYVHSVAAGDRRDLGVTRYDLAAGTSSPALEPLSPSETFGPTFATELRWSLEGHELAVQACGFSACRTRVLEVADHDVQAYEGAGHGAIVGLTETDLFVFDRCHWAPCALLAIDRASGSTRTLVDEAFGATLTLQDGKPMLTVDTAAGTHEVVP
jgi:hypothetical protein